MNEGFKTENFAVINYEDDTSKQKFIIVGVQTDGYLWMKTYEVRKVAGKHIQTDIQDDKLETYNKEVLNLLKL